MRSYSHREIKQFMNSKLVVSINLALNVILILAGFAELKTFIGRKDTSLIWLGIFSILLFGFCLAINIIQLRKAMKPKTVRL